MNAEQERLYDAVLGNREFATWKEMADEVEAMIARLAELEAENERLKLGIIKGERIELDPDDLKTFSDPNDEPLPQSEATIGLTKLDSGL